MRTIADQMLSYSAYHRDGRNKISHFIGVPLIIFALFVALGWFRFVDPSLLSFPLTGATLLLIGVSLYYFKLDWRVALLQLPFSLALLYVSEPVARLPFARSALWFGATFGVGWLIQLIGHAFEGRRPALVDNLLQVFNAPLFLTLELMFYFGYKPQLRAKVEAL